MSHKISIDWLSPIKIIKIENYNVKSNVLLYYVTDKNNCYDVSLFLFIGSTNVAYDILYFKNNIFFGGGGWTSTPPSTGYGFVYNGYFFLIF